MATRELALARMTEGRAATAPDAPANAPRDGTGRSGVFLLLVLISIAALSVALATRVDVLLVSLALAGALIAGFVTGYLSARAARTSREAQGWQQMGVLMGKVDQVLEGAAAERVVYDSLFDKVAQQVMPSGKELDAVAAKLPFPKEWHEEDFDPF